VRIESNVVVTADGAHNLTNVPRTIDEVEAVMAGRAWDVPDSSRAVSK
jgi:Xaa-Pro dipeptidase